tara:strand:- start:44 stop:652 length:609 start_codon:yes stop_codon:yes gene_type:complete
MNFINQQDNLLTKEECNNAIDWILKNGSVCIDQYSPNNSAQYQYCDLVDMSNRMPYISNDGKSSYYLPSNQEFAKRFSPPPLKPLYNAINKLRDTYIDSYPEVFLHLAAWDLEYVRFKWWKPGKHFSDWHSEHDSVENKRVFSFLIYLSDNDCSTMFKRYEDVETRAGRGIMFPAYFTHTHKGSICKKGLDRYLISGYYCFT